MKRYLLIVLILFAKNIQAEPTLQTNFNYYIYPTSLANLEKELINKSPIKENKITFLGKTDWRVTWQYSWAIQNKRCRVTSVKTNVDVVFTAPAIPTNFVPPLEVKTAFSKFYSVLMTHENNHLTSGLNAAREIESSFYNIASSDNCVHIKSDTDELGKKIIEKYNRRDIDYDNATNHGETEGASIKNFI